MSFTVSSVELNFYAAQKGNLEVNGGMMASWVEKQGKKNHTG